MFRNHVLTTCLLTAGFTYTAHADHIQISVANPRYTDSWQTFRLEAPAITPAVIKTGHYSPTQMCYYPTEAMIDFISISCATATMVTIFLENDDGSWQHSNYSLPTNNGYTDKSDSITVTGKLSSKLSAFTFPTTMVDHLFTPSARLTGRIYYCYTYAAMHRANGPTAKTATFTVPLHVLSPGIVFTENADGEGNIYQGRCTGIHTPTHAYTLTANNKNLTYDYNLANGPATIEVPSTIQVVWTTGGNNAFPTTTPIWKSNTTVTKPISSNPDTATCTLAPVRQTETSITYQWSITTGTQPGAWTCTSVIISSLP